ncbi:MAG: class I poly(R)-hydroxyalkanoic acid synthase [Gammaproteobacteria bacterium]|jgi:polyhydroxyalkanoate synthase|nr:class I poly(R)-hydroxyalkanoic acid synthase [Gammaproteobacteria bacterium]
MSRSQDPSKHTLEDFNKSSMELIKTYFQACLMTNEHNKVPHTSWQDMFNVGHIYQHWFRELTSRRDTVLNSQKDFFKDYYQLCENMQSMLLGKAAEPIIKPQKNDKRFKANEWNEQPYFYFLQQTYLIFVHHCLQFIEENSSADPKIARQISFFTRQYLDAIAPTNFAFSNPDVLRQFINTKSESVMHGMMHFYDDIVQGKGQWHLKMTDMSAFEIGKNIATTAGKVVFQNRMMQLIQYSPVTKEVYQRPILLIPPWINKYYILDLRENNSFVKWIVEQGYTVFMISWVNPDQSYNDVTFENYVNDGLLAALDAIEEATQEKTMNVLGFCIAGTMLASALAYMKSKNDKRIASATFLASLIDFNDPGEMEVFIDENQIASLEKKMEAQGFLDGRALMTVFNLLRANELFWPYYINNYLCGKDPFAFDLLYWNCDSSNLPHKMMSYYLRNMYLENRLAHKNSLSLNGVKLDLSSVKTPCYFLSTEQDHIAPWESIYIGAQCLQGPVTFVLGGSGHIAGIVNPPSSHKYTYRYCNDDAKKFNTSEKWYKSAILQEGSWWPHWDEWLSKNSGVKVKARIPGEGSLDVIQDAPGDYVKKKLF